MSVLFCVSPSLPPIYRLPFRSQIIHRRRKKVAALSSVFRGPTRARIHTNEQSRQAVLSGKTKIFQKRFFKTACPHAEKGLLKPLFCNFMGFLWQNTYFSTGFPNFFPHPLFYPAEWIKKRFPWKKQSIQYKWSPSFTHRMTGIIVIYFKIKKSQMKKQENDFVKGSARIAVLRRAGTLSV